MSHTNTAATWRVEDLKGFDCLKLEKDVPVQQVGEHDCLVKIEAASLNYRDLIIPKVSPIAVSLVAVDQLC